MKPDKKKLGTILGPLVFIILVLLLPGKLFSFEAGTAIAALAWMGIWWVMLPVHIGVTGFVPVVVNALFAVMPMDTLLGKYATDIIFLLIGADLLTISWRNIGLDKRIALKSLYLIGPSLTQQIIVWFLSSAALAMLLPHLVVCAMITPIALSMLRYIKEDDMENGEIAPIILAAIAWGSGIGMATPISGAMNLVAISYIEELIGTEYMYMSWIIRMVPMMIIVASANLICIFIVKPKNANLSGSKEYFKKLYDDMPPITRDEKVALVMFIIVMVLAFTRELYKSFLPGLKPAFVFIIAGVLTFVIRRKDGTPFNTWNHASKELGWGLIYMIAGGVAIGAMLSSTGAIDSLAGIMKTMNLSGGFFTVLVFTAFTVLLAEISNNTSAAAISVPIVISVCKGLGIDPMPYVYINAAAFNCAYMLPTTVRAIPVGMGLKPEYLMKKGALLTVSTILVISVAGYILMSAWPAFSGV